MASPHDNHVFYRVLLFYRCVNYTTQGRWMLTMSSWASWSHLAPVQRQTNLFGRAIF
jgi:hypothetical protein